MGKWTINSEKMERSSCSRNKQTQIMKKLPIIHRRSILLPCTKKNVLVVALSLLFISTILLMPTLFLPKHEMYSQAQAQSINNIRWGVNGHPVQGGPYTRISYTEQMNILRDAGLRSYRMDLYDASPASINTLTQVVAAARPAGIQIIPALIIFDRNLDENGNYQRGFRTGQTYAQQFKQDINVWDLLNEPDNRAGLKGDGSRIEQYNMQLYVKVRGAIRGLLAGIHAGDPASRGIVNSAGWCHWGLMNQLWADGVRWDITGWNHYSRYGNLESMRSCGNTNVLQMLKNNFDRPIWITEFNVNANNANKTAMGNWLVASMTQWNSIAAKYNIEAANIYVLFNPDGAGDFGIVDAWAGAPVPNAAYNAVKNYLSIYPSR
jgi:hypothetical protein